MFNFDPRKILLGSVGNQSPIEDPTAGPNGTAVLTRFNEFLDALEMELNSKLPHIPGQVLIGTVGGFKLLNLGSNRDVLAADHTSADGIVWSPRVDLTTDQVIAGLKTFSDKLTCNSDLEILDDVFIRDDLLVEGVISGTSISLSSTAQVAGVASFGSSVSIAGATSITNNLTVTGTSTFVGALTNNSSISSPLAAFTNLTVTNTATIENIDVLNNIGINNLNVIGDTTFRDATVNGDISSSGFLELGDYLTVTNNCNIGGNLVVSGQINADSIYIGNSFEVGQDSLVSGNLEVRGDFDLTGAFNIAGNTNLTSLTADSIDISSVSNLSTLNVSGTSNLQGSLSVNSDSIFANIQVEELLANGAVQLGSTLNVNGATNVNNSLEAQSISSVGTLTVGGLLTAEFNIIATGDITCNRLVTIDTGTQLTDATINVLNSPSANITSLTCGNGSFTNATVSTSLTCSSYLNASIINANEINIGADELVANLASATEKGYVLTDVTSNNPIVYLKETADNTFVKYSDIFEYNVLDSSLDPSKILTVSHNLDSAFPSSVSVWGDNNLEYVPVTSLGSNSIRLDLSGINSVTNWVIKIVK